MKPFENYCDKKYSKIALYVDKTLLLTFVLGIIIYRLSNSWKEKLFYKAKEDAEQASNSNCLSKDCVCIVFLVFHQNREKVYN